MATLDSGSYEIAVYDWQYGPQFPQPRPRHVIDAQGSGPLGWYWQYYTPFVSMRVGEYFIWGNAPKYGSTITDLYKSKQPMWNQLGSAAASANPQAPTKGAYTGIAGSGCGPSGIPGV